MASVQIDKRWLAAGGAVLALGAGVLLPHTAGPAHPPDPVVATVPPQLADVPPQLASVNAVPGSSSPGLSSSPADIAVYVCGAVKNPGVYRLVAGLRVADALKLAGGALPDADLEQINLAEPLADAMKVAVPRKGQVIANDANIAANSAQTPRRHGHRSHGHGSRGGGHKLSAGQTLDVNTATAQELVQLPGVGPSLAQRIVDFREQNGPFQTVEDLQNVPGIGPSKFDRLVQYVRL